ncbi:MAG: response regulator [Rhodocyclaceae bacterium]|nr:response regulator [Rhodocyclaceae bacterium]MDZ4213627.1 response regulator [Rhodocyclaceae bacterium]
MRNRANAFLIEWALLVSALLLLAGSIGWSLYDEHQGIDQRERERLAAQAKVVHDNLSRQLGAINRALLSVREGLPQWAGEADGMARASGRLTAFVDAMPGVRTMTLIDAEGIVRAASRPDIPPGTNFRERAYFQAAMKNPDPNTFYISPPFKTSLGAWTLNVVRMVPGPQGEFAGIVSATLDPDEFKILLESVRYAPDMRAALGHADGLLFLMMPERPDLAGADLAKPDSFFTRHRESGQTSTVLTGTVLTTGEQRMLAQHTIQPAALHMDKPLVIAVGRDLDALYAGWLKEARFRGGLVALLAATTLPGLYWLQRRRNIFERQAASAEAALREKHEELETLNRNFVKFLENTSDFIYFKDRDGRLIFCSQTLATITGHTSWRDMIGKHDRDVFPADTASIYEEEERPIFRNGMPLLNKIDPYYDEQGNQGWVNTSKWPLFDDDGRTVAGIFGISRDITELKLAQLQLETVNTALKTRTAEAEAASHAKGAFLANMSHEIRTPMNAVLGLLQLLQHTPLDARQLDYAKKAQGAAQSLLAILNDILDFSKVEAGKMTMDNSPFRLDDLLRNLSVVLSAALHNKAVEVLFQLDPDVPRVMRGDGLRLQQVLLNLAGNAIKFTEHGEVIIALRLIDAGPESIRIEFSVRDTGIGIPADRLKAVFEGFTQAETSTTRRYGGTGLGLAISQRLVHLMGGKLAAESTPGQGSHFYFTLDFGRDAETRASEQRETTNATLPATAGTLRVLITDDNATARDILASMASSFGWQITTADSGSAAIELLRQEAAAGRPFDILCVDWLMPGMDGWETVQHIRAAKGAGHVPAILMITAHGRDLLSERLNGQASPLDGFLVKPVTPSMLFDAVAQATRGASVSTNAPPPAAAPDRPLAGLRILVVEDNPLNQQVAQELLSHAGAWVQVANDGRQGIASFSTTHPPFDAILMDIQMPEMDGYEATHILRKELGATLPIIAMTANAMPADRETCLAAGMIDHIRKPIDINEVIATLLHHCRGERVAVTQPTTTADAPLPDLIDGFDLAAALARLDGNRPLFASLARHFDHDQDAIMSRVEQALRQGDRVGAARELHTLKGLAATLGATTLARLAADSEIRIKAGTERVEDDSLLANLRETLGRVTAILHTVADRFDPPHANPEALADPARLRELLAELDSLLAKNNLRALDVHGSLKREAGNLLGDGLAALDEAIASLNFSAAREKVANLLTLINHAPD